MDMKFLEIADHNPPGIPIVGQVAGIAPGLLKRSQHRAVTLPVALPQISGLDRSEIEEKKALLEANYKDPVLRGNGKIWLLYQAVTGYELFTGEKPNLGQMSDVI